MSGAGCNESDASEKSELTTLPLDKQLEDGSIAYAWEKCLKLAEESPSSTPFNCDTVTFFAAGM